MKRFHLFEFEDFKWFPNLIRDGGTDFLGFILRLTKFYDPIVPVLENTIRSTGLTEILDLCSGNGGPILSINTKIDPELGITFILSDKFPNIPAYESLKRTSNNRIDFLKESVDVLHSDTHRKGIRTMFSAIHHFQPNEVQIILKNTMQNDLPICIFDSGDKNILTILGILIFHPLLFFFCTPFIRPFTWSRILFTYIIPLIPLYTIWDGVVSILRLYNPKELHQLAESIDPEKSYEWKYGKLKNRIGFSVMYLTGIPS